MHNRTEARDKELGPSLRFHTADDNVGVVSLGYCGGAIGLQKGRQSELFKMAGMICLKLTNQLNIQEVTGGYRIQRVVCVNYY